MSKSLELAISTIQRLIQAEAPHSIGDSIPGVKPDLYNRLILQLRISRTLLDHPQDPSFDWHALIYEEFWRVVKRISTLLESPEDTSTPAEAREEHLLEEILDLRWWTWVCAPQVWGNHPTLSTLEASQDDLGIKLSGLSLGSDSIIRHLPSYSFEMWQRKTGVRFIELLEFRTKSDMLVAEIRNADFATFISYPPTIIRDARRPSSIHDDLKIDLAQDLLGASSTGYVMRTTCSDGQGGSCVLKRIDTVDEKPPDLARLWHPHVVHLKYYWIENESCHDGATEGSVPNSTFMTFLVMELMHGDLAKLMNLTKKAGVAPFSLGVAVDVMLQIAKGMLYLHDMGVSHPHLKCENILCRLVQNKTGEAFKVGDVLVKLGGFGCSRTASTDTKNRDVFCFGLTCLELLTGDTSLSKAVYEVGSVSRPAIPDDTPSILMHCIRSCLDAELTFSEVVVLLLLAQLEIMQARNLDRMMLLNCTSPQVGDVQTKNQDLASSSRPATGGLREMFHVHQLHPQVLGEVHELPNSVATVTLIFFHGFPKVSEEWRMTWMTRDNQLVWPQKWLPEDVIGDIRVLSVSFDDHLNMSSSKNRREMSENLLQCLLLSAPWNLGKAKQKIILVGHSFGGVIIKTLVNEAKIVSSRPRSVEGKDFPEVMICRGFLKSLASVVFFSVPHTQTLVEFENYITGCSKTRVLQRSSLLKSLRADDSFIREMTQLSKDFDCAVQSETEVLAFLEGKPMIKKTLVVTEKSCELLGDRLPHKVENDNHFEICRPDSRNHTAYKILLQRLQQHITSLRESPTEVSPQKCFPASRQTLLQNSGAVASGAAAMAMPFHQLSPPEGTDQGSYDFDVVFFHGLQIYGGDKAWESTWVSPKAGPNEEDVSWHRELLPQDFDKVRVLSASLDSDATKLFGRGNTESTEDLGGMLIKSMLLYGLGERKFVMVGDSLGGLVIKNVIGEAHRLSHMGGGSDVDNYLRSACKSFLDNLQGIVFYAVPHTGSDATNLFKILKPELSKIIKDLKPFQKKMVQLSVMTLDAFSERKITIIAFTEEKTNGRMIVTEASAMQLSGKQCLRLEDCNHSEVCKPPHKKHLGYLVMLSLLKRCGAGEDEGPPLRSNLRGMKKSLEKLVEVLERSPSVGVVGMGGIGKTTLVKEFFCSQSVAFEAKSMLLDVKMKNIVDCQHHLLQDIVKDGRYNDSCPPRNKEEGIDLLRKFLQGRRVLIILDDVSYDSVGSLIPEGLKLHPGSKIILTSRDSSTLKNHADEVLKMQYLSEVEAMEVFCLHAFKGSSCPVTHHGITKDIVRACGGLPLSLEVVGSFLLKKQGESIDYWRGVLRKLKNARALGGGKDDRLWRTLEISFNELDESNKGKFLDVVCFFSLDICSKYVTKEMAIAIWGCEGDAYVDMGNLVDRHLVSINEEGFLSVHEQLLDMGRNILKTWKEFKFTRISDECDGLRYEDARDLSKVEGLYLANKSFQGESSEKEKIKELHELRILILKECDEATVELLNSLELKKLRWVLMLECSTKKLPSFSSSRVMTVYSAKNWYRAMDVEGFELKQVPAEIGNLVALTTLDLSGCESLQQLPAEIGKLVALTTLDLSGCESLQEVPAEIGKLVALTTLNLWGCESLQELPAEISKLVALTTLDLSGCESLQQLPAEIGKLVALTTLNLWGCKSLQQLPAEIGKLVALTTLNLWGCLSLQQLPAEIGKLVALTTLDLSGCESLQEVPAEIGKLVALTTLNLWGCESLQELPAEIGNLVALTTLNLNGCESLLQLPAEIGKLVALGTLNLEGCESLQKLPAEIGKLVALTTLDLSGCESLQEVPAEIGKLVALTTLNLEGCESLQELPAEIGKLVALTTLNLWGCKSLQQLPAEIGKLVALTTLNLWGCLSLQQLPAEIGKLVALTTLDLSGCESLQEVPAEIGKLVALTTLNLEGCESLQELPAEIGKLVALTTLILDGCQSLQQLPAEIGKLVALTTLNLKGCLSLQELPAKIGQFVALTTLNLDGCKSLQQLPAEIGKLVALTTLNLEGCESLQQLAAETGNLVAFTTLNLNGCESLQQLAAETGNLVALTTLNLDGCESLLQLPAEIGNLVALTTLNLWGCLSLQQLPAEIGKLVALRTLNLDRCKSLQQVPAKIGKLVALTTLYLRGCKSLQQLPAEIGKLVALRTLDLSGCESLQQLPAEIGNLVALTTLNLEGCESLQELPAEIGKLVALTTLNLWGCKSLQQVPAEIGNLVALTTLNLNGCESLLQLPAEIGKLVALGALNLEGCESLQKLPAEIGKLMALTTLNLWGCKSLQQLPTEIGNLVALTTLNLDGCESLQQLPAEIGKLVALTTLNLEGCESLLQLPAEIGNLVALTTLNLDGCESLLQLPAEIGNLVALTTLNLDGCESLLQLPAEIGNLVASTTLNLWGCLSLQELPTEIGKLVALTTLGLSGCESLRELPAEIGKLVALTTLNLWGCESLQELPAEIGKLVALTTLTFDGCKSLQQLPAKIGKLVALTTLDLRGCKSLEQLPAEIGKLVALRTLDLSGCQSLQQLPVEIGKLVALTTLNLWGCKSLQQVPAEIGNLVALTTLNLNGCESLLQLPAEIGKLVALGTLNLEGCESLQKLPAEIGKLMALTTLNLWGCKSLQQLPAEIGNLVALTTLNLDGCESLLQLPAEIGKLVALTTLNLECCESLLQLPAEIGKLVALTTLNLEGCESLQQLPAKIGKLVALTTLNLRRCLSLQELPTEIGELVALTTLGLSGCESLLQLPAEIGKLVVLTTLNLWGCLSLQELPAKIGKLVALTTLGLSGCESLQQLPTEIGKLVALTTLDLSGCESLQHLPAEIGKLVALTTLNLWGCKSLQQLPAEIGNLLALTTLTFDGCKSLQQLPVEIGKLVALTTLNLWGCLSLQQLPAEIGNLVALTTLDLRGCESLQELPAEIGKLVALGTLNLEGCESLQELPAEIGRLMALTTLNLWGCKSLQQLPAEIGNLVALTTLTFDGCKSLQQLPAEIGNLVALTTLNLWGCLSLQELPAEIGKLVALTTLDLRGCESLLQLPAEIGKLVALGTLNLEGCERLEQLPAEIGKLVALTTLNLEGCERLEQLPAEIGKLVALTTLDLRGCQSLQQLPAGIGKLVALTALDLLGM